LLQKSGGTVLEKSCRGSTGGDRTWNSTGGHKRLGAQGLPNTTAGNDGKLFFPRSWTKKERGTKSKSSPFKGRRGKLGDSHHPKETGNKKPHRHDNWEIGRGEESKEGLLFPPNNVPRRGET